MKDWFKEYIALDGRHSYDVFTENLTRFFSIILNAYVNGIGDPADAYMRWVLYIGRFSEADRYFAAVDKVTPLVPTHGGRKQ